MTSIIQQIKDFWNKKGWICLIIAALAFFIFYYFFYARKNKTGTFTKNENLYIPPTNSKKKNYNFNSEKSTVPTESRGEKRCREVLQKLFNKPFPKTRPDLLFNGVTGQNLELDMFDYDLMLAVEYNGQQHYKYSPFMHGNSKDKFYAQQYRDRIKKDACRKLKINLVEVPYTVKEDDIEEYLKQELRQINYKFN